MSTPNYLILEEISQAIEQIEKLKNEFSLTEKELIKTQKHFEILKQEERNSLKIKLQQEKIIHALVSKLHELKQEEQKITRTIIEAIDDAISKYFAEGHFKKFVADLLKLLDKKSQKYKIRINKHYSTYLPDGVEYETDEKAETFRIELDYKTYVLDLDMLKQTIKSELFKTTIIQGS